MEREERQIRNRHILIAAVSGGAVTLILLLLALFLFHLVPDESNAFFFGHLILIGLMIMRIVYLILSAWPKKGWVVGLWCLGLAMFTFITLLCPNVRQAHTVKKEAKERFETAVSDVYQMELPLSLETGEPESVEYHHYLWTMMIFQTESYTLICRYDAEEYEKELEALETRYHFRTEPLKTGVTEDPAKSTIEPAFSLGNDRFRFLQPADGSRDEFYKRCVLVFTNDENHEIGYLVYDDMDLDYVEDLTEFMNEQCGWKYIR